MKCNLESRSGLGCSAAAHCFGLHVHANLGGCIEHLCSSAWSGCADVTHSARVISCSIVIGAPDLDTCAKASAQLLFAAISGEVLWGCSSRWCLWSGRLLQRRVCRVSNERFCGDQCFPVAMTAAGGRSWDESGTTVITSLTPKPWSSGIPTTRSYVAPKRLLHQH